MLFSHAVFVPPEPVSKQKATERGSIDLTWQVSCFPLFSALLCSAAHNALHHSAEHSAAPLG
jgi:hypothetical protein